MPGAFGVLNDLGRETKHARKRNIHSIKCLFYILLIISHGCSFFEDFNNFRLCDSAASHSSAKLPAAKYMDGNFDF